MSVIEPANSRNINSAILENQQGVQNLNFEDKRLKWFERFTFDIEDPKQQLLYFGKGMADYGIFNEA